MKNFIKIASLISVILIFTSCQDTQYLDPVAKKSTDESAMGERVIYGDDNRIDIYEATDYWQQKADSTVALVKAANLTPDENGMLKIGGNVFGDYYGLCPSEPFREQRSAAYCSGSLVAPDIILTAGHCMRSANDCRNVRFVFGFAIKTEGQEPKDVSPSEVYECKNIIRTEEASNGSDFALIRLDRNVTGHEPLPIRRQGIPNVGDQLVVIGHPAGIPSKVSDGASIRTIKPTYLVSNLDTYGGNSGSAVFNSQTGLIEGILVRGETDFVFKNGCRLSNVCADHGCRGEDVTRVSQVIPYLDSSSF